VGMRAHDGSGTTLYHRTSMTSAWANGQRDKPYRNGRTIHDGVRVSAYRLVRMMRVRGVPTLWQEVLLIQMRSITICNCMIKTGTNRPSRRAASVASVADVLFGRTDNERKIKYLQSKTGCVDAGYVDRHAMQQQSMMRVRSGLLCLLVCCGYATAAGPSTWSQVAEEIAAQLGLAETLYQEGKPTEAGHAVIQAYFGIFEERKMEAAMRSELGATHTYQVEQQFGALRKAIRTRADRQTVQELAQGIREAVASDARALDRAKIPMEVFEVDQ